MKEEGNAGDEKRKLAVGVVVEFVNEDAAASQRASELQELSKNSRLGAPTNCIASNGVDIHL